MKRALVSTAAICLAVGFSLGRSTNPPRLLAEANPISPNAQPAKQRETPKDDGKLRIICFGAHPDDCELRAGGVAAMWAARGHHVKFVSMTNGDIGHWRMAGGPLAQRRKDEVEKAAKMLGITTQVLDIHDGELEPTLENRKKVTRLIRDWQADIVMSHRPNDYHPDHRYTGQLVQDSAFMSAVPFICPDTKPTRRNPVFLFFPDRFQTPTPFQPDLVVSIDEVITKKVAALMVMESQFYEGGALGSAKLMPRDETGRARRLREVRAKLAGRYSAVAKKYRKELAGWYGKERADKIGFAEAFQICEYGRQPNRKELETLFPFFGKKDAR